MKGLKQATRFGLDDFETFENSAEFAMTQIARKVQYFDNIQIASLRQNMLVFAQCTAIAKHSESFGTPCAFPSNPCCIWVLSNFSISSLFSVCSCTRNFYELMHEVPKTSSGNPLIFSVQTWHTMKCLKHATRFGFDNFVICENSAEFAMSQITPKSSLFRYYHNCLINTECACLCPVHCYISTY